MGIWPGCGARIFFGRGASRTLGNCPIYGSWRLFPLGQQRPMKSGRDPKLSHLYAFFGHFDWLCLSSLNAPSTCSSTAPGGLELASGMAWRTAAMISFITCQSSIERLPGSYCSTVSLTSCGINRAHVAKKTVGLVLAVLIIASRPSSDQTSARSFRKAWLNTVRLPTGLPFGLPETPGGHNHGVSADRP